MSSAGGGGGAGPLSGAGLSPGPSCSSGAGAKRGAGGGIKKPPVEATAWCYTGTRSVLLIELQTKVREDFTITEKVPTMAFSWLKEESTYSVQCFNI